MAACRCPLLVRRSQPDRGMAANVFTISLLTCSVLRKSQLDSRSLQERKAESTAEKRLRERLEQAHQKEAARDTAKKVKAAEALISKAMPTVEGLELLLGKPEMMGVPVAILEQAKLHLKNVKATVEAARAVIASNGAGSRSLPDVKTLVGEISSATKARALITQSLALVARMTQ